MRLKGIACRVVFRHAARELHRLLLHAEADPAVADDRRRGRGQAAVGSAVQFGPEVLGPAPLAIGVQRLASVGMGREDEAMLDPFVIAACSDTSGSTAPAGSSMSSTSERAISVTRMAYVRPSSYTRRLN